MRIISLKKLLKTSFAIWKSVEDLLNTKKLITVVPRVFKARDKGRKVSFLWFWVKGRKISSQIGAPMFIKSAVQAFIKLKCLYVRRVQRKKNDDKFVFFDKLKEWLLNCRENSIKSGKKKSTFNEKWGRFLPRQRLTLIKYLFHISLIKNYLWKAT